MAAFIEEFEKAKLAFELKTFTQGPEFTFISKFIQVGGEADVWLKKNQNVFVVVVGVTLSQY